MSNSNQEPTVAQMVADNAALAAVFQRHAIDFCCHGDVSLDRACADRGLDPQLVRAQLDRVLESRGAREAKDLRSLSTPDLLEYIVGKHHAYLSEAVPSLVFLAAKVAHVHGEHNPKLVGLSQEVASFSKAIAEHLELEERVLFPALVQDPPDSDLIRSELRAMFDEHLEVGTTLARLRALSDGFSTPEWGCRSYKALMTELDALETDTLQHVHAENHILMPRFDTNGASRPNGKGATS